jgi:uncharacterized protein (TIGR03086 family)
MGMESVDTLQQVFDQATAIVGGVSDAQLDEQSPCAEWKVRDVVNHIIGGAKLLTIVVDQGSISDEQLGAIFGGDNLGSDFKDAWATAGSAFIAACRAPGNLEKVVKSPFGEMPVEILVNILVFDVMTHAADIASATGQTIGDEALLATALATGRQMIGPDARMPGRFDAERTAPDGASAQDQLLAFAGRAI